MSHAPQPHTVPRVPAHTLLPIRKLHYWLGSTCPAATYSTRIQASCPSPAPALRAALQVGEHTRKWENGRIITMSTDFMHVSASVSEEMGRSA